MNTLRQLLGYTANLRHYYLIIAVCSIVGTLTTLATPYVIKYATDWVVAILAGEQQFDIVPLLWLFAAQIVIAIISTLATDIGGWFGDVMAVRARRQLSTQYFAHLMKLPQSYFDNELTGKIVNRLSRAITDITQFLQFFSNNLLQMLLTMGVTIAILCFYNPLIALLFVLLIPTNLYLTGRTSKKWQRYETKKNKNFDIASGRFTEVIGQIRLVRSFGSEQSELSSFGRRVQRMIVLTKKQSRYWHKMNALRNLAFGTIFAAIFSILFYEAAQRNLTVGDMTMLIALISQVSFPLRNLSYFVDSYQRAVANSRDYIEAMNEQPETADHKAHPLQVRDASIEYRDVSFGYDGKQRVLRNISFTVEPGQKLALVGESGGGKSTISHLLMRLYEPTSGAIYIEGQDIASVSRQSLRQSIATVFQDPALFSGTIRENIAYARPHATDDEIIEAAKAANAHDFISKLTDGYDTEIGERGIKLSGGQKQRIAIARALLKDAPILILDEATSSLDGKSEALVQQALDRLMKHRTVLIIAHRLSTIAHVDTIVTLRHGRVDEIGTPSQLAATDGIYAELLRIQLGTAEQAKKSLAKFDISS